MNPTQALRQDSLGSRSDTPSQSDRTNPSRKERVLLCDFNILGSRTGGQTYYANLIANHPEILFTSLSEKDLEPHNIPLNFQVSSYRPDSSTNQMLEKLLLEFRPSDGLPDILAAHRDFLKHLVSAIAHPAFDRIDLPIYYPFVEVIKKLIDRPIRLTLHGMVSDGLLGNYEVNPYLFGYVDAFRRFELASLQEADEIVAVSQLHKRWVEQTFAPKRDISVIQPWELLNGLRQAPLDVRDAPIENLNILAVGRLDGIKRPHSIVALADRIKVKHSHFIVMGMPLAFMRVDTAELLRTMSSVLEIRPPQSAWWNQFSPDDTVLVVPGVETLSYVAAEAVLHGFTTVLAPTVGIREIFDRFGITYLKLEDSCEIRPLSATERRANAEALESATRMKQESVRT